MIIYDVTEERTCIPSHIISVIEDFHDMKGCALYIKKIKRFMNPIHNSVRLQWWDEAPGSSPYYIMKVTDVTFTIQSAEILVRISHMYDIKERRNVALMTRGLGNKISTPIDLTKILNHCTFCCTTVHISEKHEIVISSKERISHIWQITFKNILFQLRVFIHTWQYCSGFNNGNFHT